jgi:hypothetical protein
MAEPAASEMAVRTGFPGGPFGLCRFRGKPADYLYFIPLAMLVSVNLWWGFHSNLKPVEAALYVISMLCVGFLEEMIRAWVVPYLCLCVGCYKLLGVS